MQREDVDRLAHAASMLGLQITDDRHRTLREHHENTAAALRRLLAERDAAFAAGLNAAQSAVADIRNRQTPGSVFRALNEAVGAIDNLRRPARP